MNAPGYPKKLLIVNILNILREYSDEDHRLTQKDILNILRDRYGMVIDRKAVARNINGLIEAGYEIEFSEVIRPVKNKKTGEIEDSFVRSDYYLVRDFTDAELRLLIDSLLFSKHIPYNQCKELVGKLEGLSSKYFESKVKHIATMPERYPKSSQLFYTIDVLDEAIEKKRQVSFKYCAYGTDKKLHPKCSKDGKAIVYTVNPYQLAAANGRYYLISNTEPHENVSHYRLDRIADIKMLDAPAKRQRDVPELKNGIDLPRHMAEHIYMFSGPSERVTFRMKKYVVNDVIDWFGTDVRFSDETEEDVVADVKVNLQAMRLWAMQYAKHATVLSPKSLADEVREDVLRAAENYKE